MKKFVLILTAILGIFLMINGYRVGEYLTLLATFIIVFDVDMCRHKFSVAGALFFIILFLKFVQYRFYISTGYDLGIFSNILHNLKKHGELFDSLNGRHGFSGHIWPSAYVLSIFFRIWDHPGTLLIIQSFAIAMTVPALCLYGRKYRYISLVVLLVVFNIYLHRISAFDFHPESLAVPLFFAGVFALEEGKNPGFFLILIFTLTLKEDISAGWLSLALYYFISRENKKAIKVTIPVLAYSIFTFFLYLKYVDIAAMKNLHYTGDFNPIHRLKPALEFFASLGFLPLFGLKEISIFSLPLLEHLSSARKIHYKLKCQYSALILPLSIIAFLKSEREISIKWVKTLVILGVVFSINARIISAYINFKRLDLAKVRYIDGLIREIPENQRVCAGNHIVPHLATRDGVTQFPFISDAEIILIDTTWHDFTPITEDSGLKIIDHLIKTGKFSVVSDSFGVLFLKNEESG